MSGPRSVRRVIDDARIEAGDDLASLAAAISSRIVAWLEAEPIACRESLRALYGDAGPALDQLREIAGAAVARGAFVGDPALLAGLVLDTAFLPSAVLARERMPASLFAYRQAMRAASAAALAPFRAPQTSLARRAARAARDRMGCDIAWRHGWRVFRARDGSGELINPVGTVVSRGDPDWLVGELPRRAGAAPSGGRAVLLLHGVGNAFGAFDRLEDSLRAGGATVVRPAYDAVAGHFHEAVDATARVLGSLTGFTRIDFCAFSMGGLVLRAALAHEAAAATRAAWGRAVLAAVPNQGSRIAAIVLHRLPPAQARVARGLISVETARLPVPPIPFGLLMADGGRMLEPLFGGPNDTLVATAEMELAGAVDRVTVPAIHAYLLRRTDAIAHVNDFLDTGRFLPDGTTVRASRGHWTSGFSRNPR